LKEIRRKRRQSYTTKTGIKRHTQTNANAKYRLCTIKLSLVEQYDTKMEITQKEKDNIIE